MTSIECIDFGVKLHNIIRKIEQNQYNTQGELTAELFNFEMDLMAEAKKILEEEIIEKQRTFFQELRG